MTYKDDDVRSPEDELGENDIDEAFADADEDEETEDGEEKGGEEEEYE